MEPIYYEYLLRIFCSLICGFCFGFERKLRHHTVGLRTLILISISSCLLSIVSAGMANQGTFTGDPTRIAAGVITGIGFLGAGAIFHQGLNIRGLTSAAIIFTVAAMGLACGAGFYIPAFVTLFCTLLIMLFMGKVEHKLFPAEKNKRIEIEFQTDNIDEGAIKNILLENGLIIHDLDIRYLSDDEEFGKAHSKVLFVYLVKSPDNLNAMNLIKKLKEFPGAKNVSVSSTGFFSN